MLKRLFSFVFKSSEEASSVNVAKTRLHSMVAEQRAAARMAELEAKRENNTVSTTGSNKTENVIVEESKEAPKVNVYELKAIRGIGPKTTEKLHSLNIRNTKQLSLLTDAECDQIKSVHSVNNIFSMRDRAHELIKEHENCK